MTKDEAWKAHVEEYDKDRFDSTSRHRRHCFDAGWEAALADTLGMLEEIAKQGLGAVAYTEMHRIEVSIWPVDKRLHYQVGYRIEPAHMREVPRAEAEALLGKGQ